MTLAFIDIGTLGQWVAVVAVLAVAFLIWRGGGGTALSVLVTANTVLEERVHDLEKQVKADAVVIAELRAKTNIALAMQPVVDAVNVHEESSRARFERMLAVQDLIAHRLGPEVTGHGRPDTLRADE